MITVPYFVIPNVLQFVLLRRSKTTCDASERESYRQRALRAGDRKSGQLPYYTNGMGRKVRLLLLLSVSV